MRGFDLKRITTIFAWLIVIFVLYSMINMHFGIIKTTYYYFASNMFLYHTVWSNVLALICAILTLYYLRNGMRLPRFLAIMKLASVAMLTMSFLVIALYLAPLKGWVLLFDFGGLIFFHLFVPLLAVLDFLFLAQMDALDVKDVFLTVIPVAVYMTVVLLVLIIVNNDSFSPYDFLHIHEQPIIDTVLWVAGFLVSQIIAAFVYWVLVRWTNKNLTSTGACTKASVRSL